jgi:hypothetical protein
VRFGIALLLVALAVAGTAAAAAVGSGNPTGHWATPKAVQAAILSRGVGLIECNGGACKIGRPAKQLHIDAEVVARVVSATVTGIGPYKLLNGARRYQLFDVRACTLYYYRGAHRFGVHFRWFTHRPPSITTITNRDGTVSPGRDDGEPYAQGLELSPLQTARAGRLLGEFRAGVPAAETPR